MIVDPVRFERAIALFDAANAEDPNQDEGQPKELLYARRMTDMIGRYAPDASEAAQLAVRAQHIKRWTVPRNSQPMTKEGYHAWRTGLYKFHAETAGELMREAGAARAARFSWERTAALTLDAYRALETLPAKSSEPARPPGVGRYTTGTCWAAARSDADRC